MSKPYVSVDAFDVRLERRASARIETSHNGLVRLSDTLTFRCHVRNLSFDAAQIECDARYALLVQPAGAAGRLARLRRVEMSIALPIVGNVCAFTAACTALYCVPAEGDRMLLGMRFVGLDRTARGVLRDFIAGHQAGVPR